MADRIGVLLEGKLEQIGDPIEIYDRPASVSVAQLVGSPRINLLPADIENGAMHVRNSSLNLALVEKDGDLPQSFSLGVRPEDIVLDPEGEFVGEVALVEPLGVETVIHITVGEQSITSLVSGLGKAAIGDNIRFNVMRKRLHFFDPEGHRV
jgi:multiple sugar transport system ATP-binding protein